MRVVIEWWYATDGPSRLWRCVMRYMDQVRTSGFESGDALVEISLAELVALRRLCERVMDGGKPSSVDRASAVRFAADAERIQWSASADLGMDLG